MPHTMNKKLIAERFAKAVGSYSREARVQQQIAMKMIGLLQQHLPAPPPRRVVEFGCGTGIYSRLLLHRLQPEQLLLNDLCSEMGNSCRDLLNERVSFVPGDAEQLPFPPGTELITSCSTLQWFEQPEVFFCRCNRSLPAHGYFAFTTFGKENMKEIRQLTGSGLAYRSRQELEALLAPLYHIVHSEEELIPLTFDAPMQVLHHLKQTGVTGTTPQHWTRGKLQQFCHQYAHQFGCESGVPLTYHPIYIIAKKR